VGERAVPIDRDLRRFCIFLFFFALIVRLFAAWHADFFRTRADYEMVLIAKSILQFHVFGNPYAIPTGPTAHEMPLFPLFLSGVNLVLGNGALAEAFNITLTCCASALRCVLLLPFCVSLGLSRRIGIVAASLSSVYISAIQTEVRGEWDGPWQALLLLAITWLTLRIWREGSWLNRTPWLWIVFWATSVLLQPALLPVLAVLLVAGFLFLPNPADRARYLQLAGMVVLAIVVFLLPWAVRNKLELGKFVWTRSNFGLEFWTSNGPNRAWDIGTNVGYRIPLPQDDPKEAELLRQVGEVRYNQMRLAEASAWIRQHPAQFAYLTARRFVAFWFPPGNNAVHSIVRVGFSVLALAGLVILFRMHRLMAVIFLLTWISFTPIYYIVEWSSRYRYPIEWELVICAAVTLSSLVGIVFGGYDSFARVRPAAESRSIAKVLEPVS
jgi:hypothetical protein